MPQKLALWPLRVAVYDRLATHDAFSAYTLRREGQVAAMPFADMGPAQFADQSTGSNPGGEYILQVDFWGAKSNAGGKSVAEMMDAATQALSDGDLTVEAFGEATYLGISTAQILDDYDDQAGELVHGVVQYRFVIYQL